MLFSREREGEGGVDGVQGEIDVRICTPWRVRTALAVCQRVVA